VYILYCMVNLRQSICLMFYYSRYAVPEVFICLLTRKVVYGCALDCSNQAIRLSLLMLPTHESVSEDVNTFEASFTGVLTGFARRQSDVLVDCACSFAWHPR
jgi:hypothetical protein